ncbi:MAG: DNA alkylation repair protein [Brevinema sp.]
MLLEIKKLFEYHSDIRVADWNYKYMRCQFDFYGLTHPLRTKLIKPFLQKSKKITIQELLNTIYDMSKEPKREFLYTAIDMATYNINRFNYHEFQQLKIFIDTNPWWDSIDRIQKAFGVWTQEHLSHRREIAQAWYSEDSIWAKRSAIILQLHLKDKTDVELLSEIIVNTMHINEFFIQKAIGWALRDFSKENPTWVATFLLDHKLSKLAEKEGSKYLIKNNSSNIIQYFEKL